MKDLLKKLLGQSSTYAFGRILARGIGFLLLPVYTRYLTPSEYGIVAVAGIVVNILGGVLTGGSRGAALKFFYEYEGDSRREFYGSLLTALVLGSGSLFLFVDYFGEAIFGFAFEETPYSPYIRMALWMAFLKSALVKTVQQRLKAGEQALAYTLINIGIAVCTAALTVWWIVVEGDGAVGAVRGRLVGMAIMAVVCVGTFIPHVRLAFNRKMLKRAFLYSIPLVPHFLAHWLLSSADRFLLERMASLSDVGVYNIGYKLGMGMSLVAGAGNNSLIPLFGNLDISNTEDVKKISEVFTYYILAIVCVGLCISLFGEEVIMIATTSEYYSAKWVVPWVVIGYVMMALYYSPTNLLTITKGDSHVVSIASTLGAFSNVVLNIIFIPIIGIFGAAITTAITYAVMFFSIYAVASHRYLVPIEEKRVSILLVAALAIFGLGWSTSPQGIFLSVMVKIGWLLMLPLLLWLIGFFRKEEMEFAIRVIRRYM